MARNRFKARSERDSAGPGGRGRSSLGYSSPPPIRRDGEAGAVVNQLTAAGPELVPSDPTVLPTFVRTTGGTITTFVPTPPPGAPRTVDQVADHSQDESAESEATGDQAGPVSEIDALLAELLVEPE